MRLAAPDELQDMPAAPGVLARIVTAHPALEIAAVAIAAHLHAARAWFQESHDSLAVVGDQAMWKPPADTPAVHAPDLDHVPGPHRTRV
jgi:hypothetical protein